MSIVAVGKTHKKKGNALTARLSKYDVVYDQKNSKKIELMKILKHIGTTDMN